MAELRKRRLGSVWVSEVGLGCWNFGRVMNENESVRVINAAIDSGVTFFDVADVYGKGQAETCVGRGVASRRDEVVIATKFGAGQGEGHRSATGLRANRGGGDPAYVRSCVESSLRRLGTDRIDVLQIHDPDGATPIEDTIGALDDLVRQGKVIEYGCANFTAQDLERAASAAGAHGQRPFVSVQNQYSLLHQLPRESGVLAFCRSSGTAFLPYFPLANGVLTGKYHPGEAVPPASRLGAFHSEGRGDKVARFWNACAAARVERLNEFAHARGHTMLELAFGWLLTQVEIACVIAGARTPKQIQQNSAAADWRLTQADLSAIDALLDDGHQLVCDAGEG